MVIYFDSTEIGIFLDFLVFDKQSDEVWLDRDLDCSMPFDLLALLRHQREKPIPAMALCDFGVLSLEVITEI